MNNKSNNINPKKSVFVEKEVPKSSLKSYSNLENINQTFNMGLAKDEIEEYNLTQ